MFFKCYNCDMPSITTALLNETIAIERLSGSVTLDDRGNEVTAWSSSSSSVQARVIHTKETTEDDDDNLESNLIRLRVMVPSTTDVNVKDRVIYDSSKWNVKGVKLIKDRFGSIFYKQLILESGY